MALKRRRTKPKTENYYKVLGTRANISQERVREKYVAKLKEFPPETHPEEFQRIREAYEILRDPQQRREYDLMRKYGDKMESLFDKATTLLQQGYLDEAETLFKNSLEMIPTVPAFLFLAHIALIRDEDLVAFNAFFDEAKALSGDDHSTISRLKIHSLLELGYAQDAYDVVQEVKKAFPDDSDLDETFIQVCLELERDEEAWERCVAALPNKEEQTSDDLSLLLLCIVVLVRTGKWDQKPLLLQRFKDFVRCLDEVDRETTIANLIQDYNEYRELGLFRAADFMLQIMLVVAPKERAFRKQRKELHELVELDKAMRRLERDRDLFPIVVMAAQNWYRRDFVDADWTEGLDTEDMWKYLQAHTEFDDLELALELVWSIDRLKKQYAAIYARYKSDWGSLVDECTAKLNRQDRRRLKSGKLSLE